MTSPREKITKLFDLDLRIETARLLLRPLRAGDVDDIWPYASDPEFPKMMSWAAHVDKEETRSFIRAAIEATANDLGVTWGIEHAGRVVGVIGLDEIRWQMRAWRVDRAEVGYWLATERWSQGFVTEAAIAVMTFGFDTLGLHKLTIGCFAENTGSRRVIEKCGFRFIGRCEDDVYRDGRWHAHLRYEMLASEWTDSTNTLRFSRPRPT
jgi:[ribosomal protein S5]-alanine N-acetyltransferase